MRACDFLVATAVLVAPMSAWAQAPAPPPPAPVRLHHHHHHHVSYHRPAQPLANSPAAAGTHMAAGTSPAPVPNENIGPPQPPPDTSAEVDPGTLHIHYPPLGNGYLPGSSPQDMANTQTPQVPGVTVKMPLQPDTPQPLPPPK
jgi:hypothetical protein